MRKIKILKEFKPDAVIGTGGYVCFPVVFIAALKKIPTIIHEQNAFPGIANKVRARDVDEVAISFEEARSRFKGRARITLTGNPIRKDLFHRLGVVLKGHMPGLIKLVQILQHSFAVIIMYNCKEVYDVQGFK